MNTTIKYKTDLKRGLCEKMNNGKDRYFQLGPEVKNGIRHAKRNDETRIAK